MELELRDIQGLVISAYAHLVATRYLFFAIESATPVKMWLTEIAGRITTETARQRGIARPETVINVALTYDGLRALGLPADSLETFPAEFVDGMARRASLLGDTGASSPENWDMGGLQNPIDLLVVLYADSAVALDRLRFSLGSPEGLREVYCQDGLFSTREPFGFRDGISQPGIQGSPVRTLPGQTVIKAGEFLLGYENEYNETPPMPTIARSRDRTNGLPPSHNQPDRRDLGRNGCYMIVRKLIQDVETFWEYFTNEATRENTTDVEVAKVRLASKCVGRWPSGAPLVLAPQEDNPDLADSRRNNIFDFMTNDEDGLACPIGAHIRRANPRDSLPPKSATSLASVNRHRIIRRGRSLAPQRPTGDRPDVTSNSEQGLMFVALNADFEQQFEFIQRSWINGTAFGGLSGERDPLLGQVGGTFTIPERPVRRSLKDMPQFVRNRGGGYFFLPGINVLKFLVALT